MLHRSHLTKYCFWILVCLLLVVSPEPQHPLPRAEAATFTVTNLNDSGAGSLRQAILDANGAAGADEINFSVTGTINLISQLDVTDDLTINGSGITLDSGNASRIVIVGSAIVMLNDLSFQNGATSFGGAIYNGGTLTITNSTFSGNTATFNGGVIFNVFGSTLEITNSTFSGNTAGGGAITNDGTVTITGSTFSGNSATDDGGAILTSGSGSLTITNSTFSGNSADNGGAIYNGPDSTLEITNSTFSDNLADPGIGGAIHNSGALTITSSTFSGNQAAFGAGTLYRGSGTIDIQSSLIVGGSCFGTINDGGNNLSFNATGCPGTVADPQLGPLQNNGGPTDTMLPATGGPAVDAYAAPCATATDQRGISRPLGSGCDIGATEQAGPVMLVASAACVDENLAVTISDGDGPFNITASAGVNTPVNGVNIGTTTINGPEKWDNLTVTETTGDTETINLGQFKCRSDERPTPLTPAHQSHTTNAFPLFSWTAITGASNYRVFVFDDKVAANRTVDIRQNSGGPTSMQLSTPLPDGRLFWRARGRQNRLWSLWSVRFTLFKDPVVPMTVSTPVPTIELNPRSGEDSAPNPVPTIGPAPTFSAPPNSR